MASTDSTIATVSNDFASWLAAAQPGDDGFVPQCVEALLEAAQQQRASDLHVEPTREDVQLRIRLDGVLQPLASLPKVVGPNIVARLKVLAGLLTYETAIPQEGRIREPAAGYEFRISTFPTIFGEKVVIRLLGSGHGRLDALDELGLPPAMNQRIRRALSGTSGGIIIAGPAGSGKTTTAYACLREIVAHSAAGRSIASLEDPVEVVVPGTSQSQVNDAAGFDMATGLRSLLRQDPEVMLIGEIRDRATAEIALQAALTGQLVITTFHAGSCTEAMHRLTDIGLPEYILRNAIRLIVAQRLLRRLCDCAIAAEADDAAATGLQVEHSRVPVGCERCRQTGYQGRVLIAESLGVGLSSLTADSAAAPPLPSLATDRCESLRTSAVQLVEAGVTSAAEVIRVLGLESLDGG